MSKLSNLWRRVPKSARDAIHDAGHKTLREKLLALLAKLGKK